MPTATIQKDEQFVAFHLAGETYAIPILFVQEIIRAREITRIPRSLPHVRGVVNLRGNIVPVIDLRMRLGLPTTEETTESRIVVVEIGSGTVGMIVDQVSQVVRIDTASIEPPSALLADHETDYVQAVGRLDDELVVILDVSRTLQV
jgi:purine-binding chemotaxis protein CheW